LPPSSRAHHGGCVGGRRAPRAPAWTLAGRCGRLRSGRWRGRSRRHAPAAPATTSAPATATATITAGRWPVRLPGCTAAARRCSCWAVGCARCRRTGAATTTRAAAAAAAVVVPPAPPPAVPALPTAARRRALSTALRCRWCSGCLGGRCAHGGVCSGHARDAVCSHDGVPVGLLLLLLHLHLLLLLGVLVTAAAGAGAIGRRSEGQGRVSTAREAAPGRVRRGGHKRHCVDRVRAQRATCSC